MSFYDYDTNQINTELLPPQLRKVKHVAWLRVLLTPLQWIRDVFFDSYIAGSTDPIWGPITVYFIGNRVIYYDNSVYECIQVHLGKEPNLHPEAWVKIQDVFIGVEERLRYNSQVIVFEYALNNWFRNIGATDQIYIVNNTTDSEFFNMGQESIYSDSMPVIPQFATDFMGVSFTPGTQYDYTIMVPATLFATLGVTTQDQESAVRFFANKYNMAGMAYNVDTF